ncbi:protein plastid movement impaired 2 [Phtheirospermum japonicum]|uniref:Protein plastid movement impaired 2 n=1 Tax=Phtheirospermum japonicum TaxID=374723 RepID=A0A830CMC9_9LAMI|nr:protein plastid movement impaired 2 [Phtheirospermum japonicum]
MAEHKLVTNTNGQVFSNVAEYAPPLSSWIMPITSSVSLLLFYNHYCGELESVDTTNSRTISCRKNSVRVWVLRLEMMIEGKLPERKIGSVKAAVSSYRERILEGNNPTIKNFQTNYPEKHYNKTRELHQATRDTYELKESRKMAESEIAEAKSELSAAKKTVKDLMQKIEETNSRGESKMLDSEKLKMGPGNSQSVQVMRELESIKRELSKLRLDMASVSEEKRKAEEKTVSSMSKTESYLNSVEALNKEIEEINEEHVLVELARIEAIKEYEEIEAQRTEKAQIYSAAIDEKRKKKKEIIRETEEVETKLAITVSDINMLERELKQVKEIDKGSLENNEFDSVTKELEDAKKELALVKEGSIQFMASMDIVRNELRHISDQRARLKKKEEKTEMNIQNLNTKLLRAKAKLDAMSAAEDKAKSIFSNLRHTLEQLRSEIETSKNKRSMINEETAAIRAEIRSADTETDSAEKRLQAALEDLNAVKSSETIALENLKSLTEKTMRNRASASQHGSTITISKFEYEYLTGQAAEAREVADKKVAAARAWIEALKASEKENQIKSEVLRRESKEMRVEGGEYKIRQTEESMNAEKTVEEDDFEKWRQMMEPEISKPTIGLSGKGLNRSVKRMASIRRGKAQRSASPRSSSFTVGRRRKAMPNLAKFFSGKRIDENL